MIALPSTEVKGVPFEEDWSRVDSYYSQSFLFTRIIFYSIYVGTRHILIGFITRLSGIYDESYNIPTFDFCAVFKYLKITNHIAPVILRLHNFLLSV